MPRILDFHDVVKAVRSWELPNMSRASKEKVWNAEDAYIKDLMLTTGDDKAKKELVKIYVETGVAEGNATAKLKVKAFEDKVEEKLKLNREHKARSSSRY